MVVIDGAAVRDVPTASDAVVGQHGPAGQWAALTLAKLASVAVVHHENCEVFDLPPIRLVELLEVAQRFQIASFWSYLLLSSRIESIEDCKFQAL